jgi:galactokinase
LTETGATIPPKRNAKGELPPLTAIEKLAYAKLCQAASENGWKASLSETILPATVLQRVMTSLNGKAWHITGIDLRFMTIGHAPLIGEVLVLSVPEAQSAIEPGEPGEENEMDFPAACVSAAQKLGAKSLRSVEMKFLEVNKSRLSTRELACARYVVSEIQRVVAAERALRQDDHRQFGQYISDSHESARGACKGSSPELDFLVELARGHPGCLGARAIGPGSLSLVAYHQAERFMKHLSGTYEQAMRNKIQTFVCQVVEGVS